MRVGVWALLILVVGSTRWPFALDEGPRAQEQAVPTFKSQVELVTVDVVVVDGKGRPVRGLQADDFTLFEDGRSQVLASFEAFDLGDATEAVLGESLRPGPVATNLRPVRSQARSFVLLVDDMSLAPTRQEVVRTAIARFLEVGLREGDELIFATTSGDAWWSTRIPEGRDDLLALAARVRGRSLTEDQRDFISEWEAHGIAEVEGTLASGDTEGAAGQPTAASGFPSGHSTEGIPGASLTRRVIDRYYERRMCIPEPPATPYEHCHSMVMNHAREVDTRRANRTRDAVAAVDRAVFALSGVRGRKSLLFFTEGFLNDPGLDVVQQVAGRCREANIVVYSLDLRGLITGGAAADDGYRPNAAEQSLMRMESIEAQSAGSVGLAEETGGFAVRNTNDLGAGAARVADESRTYYLLGYAPPEGKGPRDWRKVKVEVKRPGVEVRARKGYTLRTSADLQAAADAQLEAKSRQAKASKSAAAADPPLPTDVARALANGHAADAIPLRAMAYALEGRPGGTVRTLVAVEADMRSLSNLGGDDRPRSVLNLSIFATHRDTGKIRRIDQRVVVDNGTVKADAAKAWGGWLTVSRDLDLPPGVNQARIVVRDEFLGRLGAVTLRFLVPAAAGLRVSTALISDRLISEKAGGAPRPVLIAHRDFTPRASVYCQFQVYGAAPRPGAGPPDVETSYDLREKGGIVLRRGEPSAMSVSSDGRMVGVLTLPVDGMPQGDYELVLRVEDKTTGQVREQAEPLRISARESRLIQPSGLP